MKLSIVPEWLGRPAVTVLAILALLLIGHWHKQLHDEAFRNRYGNL